MYELFRNWNLHTSRFPIAKFIYYNNNARGVFDKALDDAFYDVKLFKWFLIYLPIECNNPEDMDYAFNIQQHCTITSCIFYCVYYWT